MRRTHPGTRPLVAVALVALLLVVSGLGCASNVGAAFDKPLLANMVDSGKTPIVSADRLKELGFNIAIYPAIGMLPAAGAMQQAFQSLLRDGSTNNVDVPMISLPEMHALMGFEDVWAFERQWARAEAAE